MPKSWGLVLLVALLSCPGLFAQDTGSAAAGTSEDEFFGTTDVEVAQGTADKQNIVEDVEKERVGLSGVLQASGSYSLTRDFVRGRAGIDDNLLSSAMTGDFLVDARLKKGVRAFVDLSLGYLTNGAPVVHVFSPVPAPLPDPLMVTEDQTTLLGVKEIFVDFNLANTVYFRVGKQVLQWGTGYFWNPTDLVNIEHKSFTSLDALREGVFGLRSDVVFAREFHLYTFLNLNGIEDISSVAFAARSEFLVGSFEFGFSGWFKSNKIPVFGVDFTTPLFWSLNLTGEASVSWGENGRKLDTNGQPYSLREQLVPKIDIGLSRSFDAFDVEDRITVNAEFFYNHAGYDDNMFDVTGFQERYYQSGYYGKYYAALFMTVNKFILSDMTLTLNGLMNISDMSAIAMAALSYSPVNNFDLSLQLGSNLGEADREYTVSNNLFFLTLGAKVSF